MESVRNATRRLKKWHSPVRDRMNSDMMWDASVRHIHNRTRRKTILDTLRSQPKSKDIG